jgi:chromate reductase, NAD(P)H dehydrogenase (quinone)
LANLIGLSGSLRKASFNTALLRAAAGMVPARSQLTVHTLHGIPLYDGDVEATSGVPQVVADLKDVIAKSDGLLLVTPEYNNSIPGVFKNAIDWMTRPPADIKRVFGGKPVAIMGASPGGFGTILSQAAWLPILRTLGTKPWFGGRLMVSRAGVVFDANGAITDEKVREQVKEFVQGFVAFIGSPRW